MSPKRSLLPATAAARILGVKPETLYAYVSRGLLQSREGEDARSRLYLREEVERLRQRRARRRDPRQATEGALDWGLPVLESSITLISDGRLYYRGHEVGELAKCRTVEEVAALLWGGSFEGAADLFAVVPPPIPGSWRRVLETLTDRHPGERMQVLLRYAATRDPTAMDLRPQRLARTGARLLTLMVASMAGRAHEPGEGVLDPLVDRWFEGVVGGRQLLHGALILCADHELNVSSFTARCVASAGSSPYEVVVAGLAALRGFRHGGNSDRAEALLAELGVGEGGAGRLGVLRIRQEVEARLERGERLPGFGQPMYPDGDPRHRVMMQLLGAAFPGDRDLRAARQVAREVERLIGVAPSVDFSLAATSRVARLGRGGAFCLFALGRTLGWIAHGIEQYGSGRLIRPRARYVGPSP